MQQGNSLTSLLSLNSAAVNKPAIKSQPLSSPVEGSRDFQALMDQTRADLGQESKAVAKPRALKQQATQENRKSHEAPLVRQERSNPAAKPEPDQPLEDSPNSDSVEKTRQQDVSPGPKQNSGSQPSAQRASTQEASPTDLSPELSIDLPDQGIVELSEGAITSVLEGDSSPSDTTLETASDNETSDDVTNTDGLLLPLEVPANQTPFVSPSLPASDLALVNPSDSSDSDSGELGDETLQLLGSAPVTDEARQLTRGLTGVSYQTSLRTGLESVAGLPNVAVDPDVSISILDSEGTDTKSPVLDSDWDGLTGTFPTAKTLLSKTGDNLLTLTEKNTAPELVKLESPVVTSVVDPLGRAQETSLGAARSFVAQINLPQTLGHPQWSQAVGERVLWLAAQNLSAADIRLDPPDLGTMHVKVSIQQDQASVSFVSPHPVVREALDQQATRLREMFAEQGLNLVHVDVSDRHRQHRESSDEEASSAQVCKQDEDDGLQLLGQSQPLSLRLVDHYA